MTGLFCSNKHFNDPRMRACAVCGAELTTARRDLSNDDRPVLGSLVLDDGTSCPLSTDYLLGRDPESDGLVRSGEYRPLRLNDDQNMISRAHARIELRNWDVVLVDNTSTNGTFFTDPASASWKRLPRSGAHLLTPGSRIRIGNRTLSFHANRTG